MDETTERKVRDLKLKILKVEKELAASLHSANLGAWLHAGHAGQIQKTAERDRERLQNKLEDLKHQLEQLAPGSGAAAAAKPARMAAKEKPVAASAATKPTKKAAAKKPTAKTKTRKS